MPLDYRSVYAQITGFSQRVRAFYEQQADRHAKAWETLQAWSGRLDELRVRAQKAGETSPHWRSAAPADEALTLAADPPADADKRIQETLVIAADGSQIEPNPHTEPYFALVNVGVVAMSAAITPRTHINSQLWTPDELIKQPLQVSQQRDLRERAILAEIANALHTHTPPKGWDDWERFAEGFSPQMPLLTLTDGPLELWGAREDEGGNFRRSLQKYLESLEALKARNAIAAGFVDKPHANLVVHLLALATLKDAPSPDDLQKISHGDFDFWGVSDTALFSKLLAPGQRSAVFALESQSRNDYRDSLALHFFYLNTAPLAEQANIARVEIPAWVARDANALATLHAVLLWQSRRVPHIPYPYILHRAHEVAVVRREDRQAVETWLCRELLHHGFLLCGRSAKQRLKDLQK